jgi:hypothetical protein
MLCGMSAVPGRSLAILERSSSEPRNLRLEAPEGSRDAAYRHLATVILRLDVASLGSTLRAGRMAHSLPCAA